MRLYPSPHPSPHPYLIRILAIVPPPMPHQRLCFVRVAVMPAIVNLGIRGEMGPQHIIEERYNPHPNPKYVI